MDLLLQRDRNFITDSIQELIKSSGQIGVRYVPDNTAENLYGKNEVPYLEKESFSLELQNLPAETLTKMGADAVVNILPDQELSSQDRVKILDELYKVLSVEEQDCFGVVSHKTVKLVKHHAG